MRASPQPSLAARPLTHRQLLLLLAETLCAEYKQPGTAAHTLLSSFKLVLVPSMNPDGFSAHRRENK